LTIWEKTNVIHLVAALLLWSDCSGQQTGLVPLTDLKDGFYQGFPGGLYSGENQIPAAHATAGLALSATIEPLNAAGSATPQGKIGMLSIGMSNTHLEFERFVGDLASQGNRHPKLVVANAAQPGQDAAAMADPSGPYWTQHLPSVLQQNGLTPAQVQVAWLKQAVARPSQPFPQHALSMKRNLRDIVQTLHANFPNLKLCYLSSRTYGGYASIALSPEPFAYESGFAVKWLIEDQIQGHPSLAFNGPSARAPWLAWGPYLWADGTAFRSDGLKYACNDFSADGTHPASGTQQKVSRLLMSFFESQSTTVPWFLSSAPSCPTPARVETYGDGAGTEVPFLAISRQPKWNHNQPLSVLVRDAPAGQLGLLLIGSSAFAPGQVPLFGGSLLVAPANTAVVPTDVQGVFDFSVGRGGECGVDYYVQYLVLDPASTTGISLSHGLWVRPGL
jgi:hypothetical protein